MKARNANLKLSVLSLAMVGVFSSMYAYADDEEVVGVSIEAGLYGTNETGADYGLYLTLTNVWSGGQPAEATQMLLNGSGSPSGLPSLTETGIHILDQNVNSEPAADTNAAILIEPQTPGATVYGIYDNNGLFTFNGWNSSGTDTLANLTSEVSGLPGEGFNKQCSDCDTPATEGAVCTNVVDNAGATALYIRGALHCF